MRKVLIGAMLLAVAASACGGDKKTGASGDGGKPAPTQTSGSADGGAFAALGAKGKSAKTKVTYKVTDADGSVNEMTWAYDGASKSSFRLKADGRDMLIINDGDDFVMCGGDEGCYRMPNMGGIADAAGGAFLGAFSGLQGMIANVKNLPGFVSKGSRTVGGRAAECAAWNAPGSTETFEVCLDKATGIGVYMVVVTPEGKQTLEATSIGTPGDADFKPTGPVQDFPTSFPVPSYTG